MNGLEMSQIEKEESCRRAMTSLIRRPLRDALKKKTEAGNMALNILMQVKYILTPFIIVIISLIFIDIH